MLNKSLPQKILTSELQNKQEVQQQHPAKKKKKGKNEMPKQ